VAREHHGVLADLAAARYQLVSGIVGHLLGFPKRVLGAVSCAQTAPNALVRDTVGTRSKEPHRASSAVTGACVAAPSRGASRAAPDVGSCSRDKPQCGHRGTADTDIRVRSRPECRGADQQGRRGSLLAASCPERVSTAQPAHVVLSAPPTRLCDLLTALNGTLLRLGSSSAHLSVRSQFWLGMSRAMISAVWFATSRRS
jgi:hypothetical protein